MSSAELTLESLTKSYGGVHALADVTVTLQPGSVVALAGENGAGKSTLIKILAGAVAADRGRVLLDGAELPADPRRVIEAGISVIYQELTDIPDMSVVDNVMLGRPLHTANVTNRRGNRRAARDALARVGLTDLDVTRPVRSLTLAQRQLVEIARCLAREARVLVFDEPTSALPEHDVKNLHALIGRLKHDGLTIVYVSHHLDELFAIADRICVLRDGRLVDDRPITEWTERSLITAMLAKDLEQAYPFEVRDLGDVRLTATDLSAPGIRDATVTARAGEIVGLVGLAGAGRTELMKAIAGINDASGGTIERDGTPLRTGSIVAAKKRGIVYSPEDRKTEGVILDKSIQDNMIYGLYGRVSRYGIRMPAAQRAFAAAAMKRFGVKAESPATAVGMLSGGNQQKVVLARAAAGQPAVMLLDDPTRGVDVGAKSGIYRQIIELAKTGVAVLLTSSDTDEVLAMADRVYVLRAGRLVGEVARADYDRERILHLAAAG
ncbi:sugar ABC transporter ATP-binding protein [Mycolicibacterium sp. 050158]|uniref:sugar ABC transporter ATP-binding protein n=1 Tax=Mycolicibacterium sp. 050158 TaxID=3090602 RepID=UPI00299E53BA|nr:sugar ABC transporter ATP-binding protein [Mycolicibacterium sp. 050158]MDX1891205.1 sugar ABC transporter ATP-binding protein [Mycolicibacterium sp. 050158]